MEDEREKAVDCPYKLFNEQTVFEGKYIVTKTVNFHLRDRANTGRVWMHAHRPHNGNKLDADGVHVIALLNKNDGKKYYILVKQFRIPLRRWIIEFPAGVIDTIDETLESAGLRELYEETGYNATKILGCTNKGTYPDPGLSSNAGAILAVEIDGNLPENQNPKQSLGEIECIEVIQVEKDKLLEYLNEIMKVGEVEVASHVYSFALSQLFSYKYFLSSVFLR